jgi:hypothetical protein
LAQSLLRSYFLRILFTLFHHRPSEVTAAVVKGSIATTQTGQRPRYNSCDAGFAAIEKFKSYGVMGASTQILKEGLGGLTIYGKVRIPLCSP